ncbi:hypothetical protein ABHI18_008669 [Aspergillus niger]
MLNLHDFKRCIDTSNNCIRLSTSFPWRLSTLCGHTYLKILPGRLHGLKWSAGTFKPRPYSPTPTNLNFHGSNNEHGLPNSVFLSFPNAVIALADRVAEPPSLDAITKILTEIKNAARTQLVSHVFILE